ncbi:MAG TPA: efflux RND transporter periplasmic adaptor subunit [Opitutaceae bacterium]|nr:efflux RND transporter periplasmic adaptor subunit [Opitutaceae bacterium]
MTPPRQRSISRLAFSALLVATVLAAGCRKSETPPASESLPSVAVRSVVVGSAARAAHEEVVGTVQSRLRAAIEPKISARIESLLVSPGQAVKAGDLIAQLDAREIQARLDQALALREQAVRELERARTLLRQQSTAQSEFDLVQARERVSLGVLNEASAMLGYTKVVAPFAGVVTRKLADVGDLATPGKPIAEMEDPRALRFEADVPEALIGRVGLGNQLAVRIGAAAAAIEGAVVELAPVANPSSRTFLVKLDLPASENLRSGQFGRVLVPVGETRSIQVPVSALVVRGQLETVFVVEKQIAQLRLVRTGRRTDTEVELLSGLVAGESVVIEGAENLRDGQPVTLKP